MYPQEYINYLVHFHGDRDFFECHEILEEYWKKTDERNKKSIIVGFILLAVSSYHHRRGNFPGAKKTLTKALQIFRDDNENLKNYGFQPAEFITFIQKKLQQIHDKKNYINFNLPIKDKQLIASCQKICKEKNLKWGELKMESGDEIIHRHIKRDRKKIILEREMAFKNKSKKGRES